MFCCTLKHIRESIDFYCCVQRLCVDWDDEKSQSCMRTEIVIYYGSHNVPDSIAFTRIGNGGLEYRSLRIETFLESSHDPSFKKLYTSPNNTSAAKHFKTDSGVIMGDLNCGAEYVSHKKYEEVWYKTVCSTGGLAMTLTRRPKEVILELLIGEIHHQFLFPLKLSTIAIIGYNYPICTCSTFYYTPSGKASKR